MSLSDHRSTILVWIAVGAYSILTASLIVFTLYFHRHASASIGRQPEIHAKAAVARARIQNETDLATLRSFALTSHDASAYNGDAVVHMMRNLDSALSAFCMALIVVGAFIGAAIRGLFRKTATPNQAMQRTAPRSDA
jgi:hypothetical protein